MAKTRSASSIRASGMTAKGLNRSQRIYRDKAGRITFTVSGVDRKGIPVTRTVQGKSFSDAEKLLEKLKIKFNKTHLLPTSIYNSVSKQNNGKPTEDDWKQGWNSYQSALKRESDRASGKKVKRTKKTKSKTNTTNNNETKK